MFEPRDQNLVTLRGTVSSKPEIRFNPDATCRVTFRITTVDRAKDGREFPAYHSVIAYDPMSMILAEELQEGMRVYVDGSLRYWKDQVSGKYLAQIRASSVERIMPFGVEGKAQAMREEKKDPPETDIEYDSKHQGKDWKWPWERE